jgi:hypothetical protein
MRWPRIRWARALKLRLLGSSAFWLPDVVLHAVAGHEFSGLHVWILTVIMPSTLLLTWIRVKRSKAAEPAYPAGTLMLVGAWVFSGFFMMLAQSFSGGGFNSPDGIRWVVTSTVLSVIPLYTFTLATYDGTLGALLLVTVAACVIAAAQAVRNRSHKNSQGFQTTETTNRPCP